MSADASAAILRVRGVESADAASVGTLLEALGYPCTEDEALERIAHFRDDARQFLLLAERDGLLVTSSRIAPLRRASVSTSRSRRRPMPWP